MENTTETENVEMLLDHDTFKSRTQNWVSYSHSYVPWGEWVAVPGEGGGGGGSSITRAHPITAMILYYI